jgi:hypothetical protein
MEGRRATTAGCRLPRRPSPTLPLTTPAPTGTTGYRSACAEVCQVVYCSIRIPRLASIPLFQFFYKCGILLVLFLKNTFHKVCCKVCIYIMLFNFIIWKVEHPARADKSAMGAINRPLRVAAPIHDIPGISLKFIIASHKCIYAPIRPCSRALLRASVRPETFSLW